MTVSPETKYEFGGVWGTTALTFGLPVLLEVFAFTCNDVTGCPALPPILASGWKDVLGTVFDFRSLLAVVGYYLLTLALWRNLPAHEIYGTKLVHHSRALKYRMNSFTITMIYLLCCATGTFIHGANFILWVWITDHYIHILTASILISYAVSIYVYINSFTVDTAYPNPELRELVPAGNTGSTMHDFWLGRELNPRITLPLLGEIDLKAWCGICPGLTAWLLLDLAFMAQQYRNYGFISSSMLFVTLIQTYYVLEGQYNETGFLTMRDITTDGLGFMLTFGDLVWVPFLYSTQARYLSVYPTPMDSAHIVVMGLCFVVGLYIFRASNAQKIRFRTDPGHPSVAKLTYIQTRRGTRLLTDGWWGVARHINYFGDWLQSFPFCLATGLAGYVVLTTESTTGQDVTGEGFQMLDGRLVLLGDARGWGVFFTYLYAVYFGVLLIHRERRDDELCAEKYGEDWERYRKIARWRIVPRIY